MLSASLKLFFETWERERQIPCVGRKKKAVLWGYPDCFKRELQIDWSTCPADMAILEQVALARDRDQHPDHISTFRVKHSENSRKKYPTLFFINEVEQRLLSTNADPLPWWFGENIHVDRDPLFKAIDEVEKLAEWLDAQIVVHRF